MPYFSVYSFHHDKIVKFAGKEYNERDLFCEIYAKDIKPSDSSKFYYFRHNFFEKTDAYTFVLVQDKTKIQRLRRTITEVRKKYRISKLNLKEAFINSLYFAVNEESVPSVTMKFKVPEKCMFKNVKKTELQNFTELFNKYLSLIKEKRKNIEVGYICSMEIAFIFNRKTETIGMLIDHDPLVLNLYHVEYFHIPIAKLEEYTGKIFTPYTDKKKLQTKFEILDI